MFGLIDGRLDMILPAPDGREIVVHLSTPGNWFAETTTLSRATIKAACRVASQRALVLALRDVDLFALLDREPWLHRDFYALSNEKRTIVQDLLVEALTFTGLERVAQRLAYLHAKKRLWPEGHVEISQDGLAEMVGVSAPTVQRALRAFRRRGLIETRYGGIRIIDANGLAAFRQHDGEPETGHGENGEVGPRHAAAETDHPDEAHQAIKSGTAQAD
ncbi:Crp/Fnr family transcriptional regulator [Limibaculum sp. FT325]|nr:Crp/Fnr family transcriptional regulator [Limibaculum sediminis]